MRVAKKTHRVPAGTEGNFALPRPDSGFSRRECDSFAGERAIPDSTLDKLPPAMQSSLRLLRFRHATREFNTKDPRVCGWVCGRPGITAIVPKLVLVYRSQG